MSKQQVKPRKPRHRTYARNRPVKAAKQYISESDGTYFLKLVCVVLAGTLWIKLSQPIMWAGVIIGGVPLGALIGFAAIALFEKNQLDRKIWYAVLLIVTIICYFLPAGIVI
jgi:positive regulator of sigma E activity